MKKTVQNLIIFSLYSPVDQVDVSSAKEYIYYPPHLDRRHSQYDLVLKICARVCDVSMDVMHSAVRQLERHLLKFTEEEKRTKEDEDEKKKEDVNEEDEENESESEVTQPPPAKNNNTVTSSNDVPPTVIDVDD